MRKSVLTLSVAAALAAPGWSPRRRAPAAAPSPLTGNMAIVSEYMFRGISQTSSSRRCRAASTTRTRAASTSAPGTQRERTAGFTDAAGIEMDFYGGYKKSFGDSASTSGCSTTTTRAPRPAASKSPTRSKVYIGGSWKWLTAKYSYAFSDYFGLVEHRRLGLPRPADFTMEVAAKLIIVAHYGHADDQERRRAGLHRLEARRHV